MAFQIDLPLSIFLIILIAVAIVSTSLYFINKTTLERAEKATQTANYTARHTMEYFSIGWLVDYWRENCDNLALIYDSTVADNLETEVSKNIPGYTNP